jgi:hypothetical protein
MPFLFLICVFVSLWIVQATIVLPFDLFAAFHFPFWLTLTLVGILVSWLIGE